MINGEYTEERPGGVKHERKPWSVVFRRKSDLHTISRVVPSTTTLILRGRDHDDWGFEYNGKIIPWQRYLGKDKGMI